MSSHRMTSEKSKTCEKAAVRIVINKLNENSGKYQKMPNDKPQDHKGSTNIMKMILSCDKEVEGSK